MPIESYGVLQRCEASSPLDRALEELRRDGFTILFDQLSAASVEDVSRGFESARSRFIRDTGGVQALESIGEQYGVRLPLKYDRGLLDVATVPLVMEICRALLGDYFILNQQNGVVNPASGQAYGQGKWHRDLPYQHLVMSRPVLVNALYCVDEFTNQNGATLVLPGSHLHADFPSDHYVERRSIQLTAPAGSFILLDGMTYHSGGVNTTSLERRAINHVYSIPQITQQIEIASSVSDWDLDEPARRLLGLDAVQPRSVHDFLSSRRRLM